MDVDMDMGMEMDKSSDGKSSCSSDRARSCFVRSKSWALVVPAA
eukprot:CAMPEP_0201931988 /NCGR_PEP_ID=MMETSP0903-20130614/28519_1 /ASSEMBLY_ACC=CAM_ASM_000552 /TAXON_ID=420261 /ORGANISM="Thalassiosira antarctica, Strain CCMP982" /LENGTH=43 /DNA_ID= /DNA_START= /DNA_END= /DNA_ORIENTATION=